MNLQLFHLVTAIASCVLLGSTVRGESPAANALDEAISQYPIAGVVRSAIGVTRADTPIPCLLSPESLDADSKKFHILLIGGLDGQLASVRLALEAMVAFQKESKLSQRYTVSCVPCARPDALDRETIHAQSFPPRGNAYNQPDNDVAHYLWRWIGMHAPDLVIDLRAVGNDEWVYPNQPAKLLKELQSHGLDISDRTAPPDSLVAALNQHQASGVGSIPALQTGSRHAIPWITAALDRLSMARPHSEARNEIKRRLSRSPLEIARELSVVYGHQLDSVQYIPALAVIGRMRLGELTNDPQLLRDAIKLGDPYLSGERESMPPKSNGSTLSGHLVFSQLARRSGDSRWTALAKKAADDGFDANGQPKESMPFHNEMSDSVFMGCAILAEVGALTEESKYFDQCVRHLQFMQTLCLRDDGLYRHSPLNEAAWGRGNGFPALGMALSLSALPADTQAHRVCLNSYRDHLQALKEHQDPTGAWHQVIDREESYREFTSTCMITFAIVRGLRQGWIDAREWTPVVEKSWRAIKSRIGSSGQLVDVCTGTGKQKTVRDYHDRTAILGRDDRGGAMALLVATEIAYWEKQ
ncbi:Unsaturated rhamnogalacturonyl hydrolase YesR [Stieleria neptunia]|uniref:Unsaturated rhamnogalacturonyl hydrolase YesR n=1 Tax=Stieleria neptunia TaxID=2527979 RepID=A0A518HHT0_9BACT|nr:glycoside hydrolase family 88 protein [Stieleria neptunia]QDV40403.1 Unsaturated rhamnogalacturonyl hydrolase YesR [Stieleria neptunia]